MGINTGHIQTTDFVLEEPDIEFVVEVRAATLRDWGVQLFRTARSFYKYIINMLIIIITYIYKAPFLTRTLSAVRNTLVP